MTDADKVIERAREYLGRILCEAGEHRPEAIAHIANLLALCEQQRRESRAWRVVNEKQRKFGMASSQSFDKARAIAEGRADE